MFNHEDIWNAIDALAEANGFSPSGLAKEAGLDPTTFNKSKRQTAEGKLRWPSTESLSKVLFITQTTLEEFLSLISDQRIHHSDWEIPYADDKDIQNLFSQGDVDHISDSFMLFPDGRDNIVCLDVQSAAFEPHYKKGTALILDTKPNIRRHDRLFIIDKDQKYHIGFLQKETANKIVLESTTNQHVELDKNEIRCLNRILWASQ